MDEIKTNLIDCISNITNRQIAMSGDDFVYLDTKKKVEQSVLDEAIVLKAKKDVVLLQQEFENAIQSHLDVKAQTKGYTNIVSACSYAGYPNQFQSEAIAYGTWRGDVWTYAYEQLALIQAGSRTMPTIEEMIAELPKLGVINE